MSEATSRRLLVLCGRQYAAVASLQPLLGLTFSDFPSYFSLVSTSRAERTELHLMSTYSPKTGFEFSPSSVLSSVKERRSTKVLRFNSLEIFSASAGLALESIPVRNRQLGDIIAPSAEARSLAFLTSSKDNSPSELSDETTRSRAEGFKALPTRLQGKKACVLARRSREIKVICIFFE